MLCSCNCYYYCYCYCYVVTECKGHEDRAIAIVNSCKKNEGGKIIISNFRTFLEDEEDAHQDDFELYDDYDGQDFDYY